MDLSFPARSRRERTRRQYRLGHGRVPIDQEDLHEDDADNRRVSFHEKYGRVRSLYLANFLEMVEEMDDHRGAAETKKMSNEPVAVDVAPAMKPVAKELGSGQFYGHGIELLQNLSLLADTSVMKLKDVSSSYGGQAEIQDKEEDRGKNIVVKEEDDRKIKRKTCDGGSSSSSGPAGKKNKKMKPKMQPPVLLPAWMIDKFHQLGAAMGDHLRVSHKETENSDVERQQSRLLLSKKMMEESRMLESLTEEEVAEVHKPDGLSVLMVDGEKSGGYRMFFKFLTSANSYRIIGKWMEFVTDSKLQPHLHTLHLCFFHLQADPRELRLGVIKTITGNVDAGPVVNRKEEEILQQQAIAEGKKPILHSFDLNLLPSDNA